MLLVVSFLTPAVYADNALTKLARGVTNILASPVEFLFAIFNASDEKGLAYGIAVSPFVGLWKMTKRGAVGVYEVATFPIPIPRYYKPVLEKPNFTVK